MRVCVSGGAGFIGSQVADSYLVDGAEVSIFDDLSTGFRENIDDRMDFVEGSVVDLDAVRKAIDGAEVVFHQAAARAVSRSVEDPLGCDLANTHGTLNVLVAARDAGVRRVVLASSSSVYGGAEQLPTPESAPLIPRSPYAVTKLALEEYARVCSELYEIETVCLRYFNVYGPRQRPDSQYAAVIPLFIDALRSGRKPVLHGDGLQFRDFTYIDDVVALNRLAATADAGVVSGKVYNGGRGDRTTILDVLNGIAEILGVEPTWEQAPTRAGDVRQSCADISAARRDLGYDPQVSFGEGLRRTVEWFADRAI